MDKHKAKVHVLTLVLCVVLGLDLGDSRWFAALYDATAVALSLWILWPLTEPTNTEGQD
jgi:hypothetical protein